MGVGNRQSNHFRKLPSSIRKLRLVNLGADFAQSLDNVPSGLIDFEAKLDTLEVQFGALERTVKASKESFQAQHANLESKVNAKVDTKTNEMQDILKEAQSASIAAFGTTIEDRMQMVEKQLTCKISSDLTIALADTVDEKIHAATNTLLLGPIKGALDATIASFASNMDEKFKLFAPEQNILLMVRGSFITCTRNIAPTVHSHQPFGGETINH